MISTSSSSAFNLFDPQKGTFLSQLNKTKESVLMNGITTEVWTIYESMKINQSIYSIKALTIQYHAFSPEIFRCVYMVDRVNKKSESYTFFSPREINSFALKIIKK